MRYALELISPGPSGVRICLCTACTAAIAVWGQLLRAATSYSRISKYGSGTAPDCHFPTPNPFNYNPLPRSYILITECEISEVKRSRQAPLTP